MSKQFYEVKWSPDFETFCQMAKDIGATRAKVISPQSMVTAAWMRLKCQYGCGG